MKEINKANAEYLGGRIPDSEIVQVEWRGSTLELCLASQVLRETVMLRFTGVELCKGGNLRMQNVVSGLLLFSHENLTSYAVSELYDLQGDQDAVIQNKSFAQLRGRLESGEIQACLLDSAAGLWVYLVFERAYFEMHHETNDE